MAEDLRGRVAFITGASRGVGKCIALALGRAGCHVAVAAKSTESTAKLPGSIFETARELEALDVRALPLQLDVRDNDAVDAAVAQTVSALGRLDILINNAGALFWHPVEDTTMKSFDLVMDVNARGAFACTRAALPHMKAGGWGHIIMMSPPITPGGAAGKVAYSISKFGMTLIAHGLAGEVRDHNIACNALWPATLIESYATLNWNLGGPEAWRKPDILADACLAVLQKAPRDFTGHALIDEDFLRGEGITDFASYRCLPDVEPPRVPLDFHLSAGTVKAK